MTNVKILCHCGTKFAFEADEALTLAAGVINCPSCGADAAEQTNAQLAAARTATHAAAEAAKPAPVRISLRPPMPTAPAEPAEAGSEPEDEAPAPEATPAGNPYARFGQKPLTKAEQQIRRNRESAQRRKPYIVATVVFLIVSGVLWGWYRFALSKPKVTMNVQYERVDRPVVPRLLDDGKLFLIRNRTISLTDLEGNAILWEKSFGNVTNFDDNMPIFSEVSARVDRSRPDVRVTSNVFWVIWPDHLLSLDRATGGTLTSIQFAEDEAPAVHVGDRLLVVEKPSAATNRLAFDAYPLDGGKAQPFDLPLPPRDADLALIPDGPTVVALQSRMFERRIVTNKLSRGPRVMTAAGIEKEVDNNFDKVLNENLTAGNSLNATIQLVEQLNRRDAAEEPDETYEDRSIYEVELRRVLGGTSKWVGKIEGSPVYFPLPTIDVVAGNNGFTVIDKSGRQKWAAPLSYPLSAEALAAAEYHQPSFSNYRDPSAYDDQTGTTHLFPFLEHAGGLFAYDRGVLAAFDLESGEVRWRVTSVGIRKLVFDPAGMLYVCTTLDSPQSINQPAMDRKDEPVQAILKIDPATGTIVWQAPHLGSELFVSGKFLYSLWIGENLLDKAAAMAGNTEPIPSCALTRIDPGSGAVLWRREYRGEPDVFNARGTRLLLQFPRRIEMLNFFSL